MEIGKAELGTSALSALRKIELPDAAGTIALRPSTALTSGRLVKADSNGDLVTAGALITVQTGSPVAAAYLTPLIYDDTAVTGGLWAWGATAYVKIGPLL